MEASATPPAEDEFDLVGQVLEERIEIESVVGSGGFSVVYRARHHAFDEPVAVKCLRTSGFSGAQLQEYLASFRREGQLLLKLCRATQNVVRILNMGDITRNGVLIPYLVLERLEGRGLDDWMDARSRRSLPPLTLEETVRLLDCGVEALARAHAMGIAHRDIKPSNLWVITDERGREKIKLIDFGIAKQFDASLPLARLQTQLSKVAAYTPTYGTPEQFARGKAGVTGPHTDVFATALVCVELLSGLPALGRDDDTDLILYQEATRTDQRPTPRARGAKVTDDVERVFLRALAVNIHDRYANAAEFWRALCHAARFPLPGWLSSSDFPPAHNKREGDIPLPAARGSTQVVPTPAPVRAQQTVFSSPNPALDKAPAALIPPAPRRASPGRPTWLFALLGLLLITGLGGAFYALAPTASTSPSSAASVGGLPIPAAPVTGVSIPSPSVAGVSGGAGKIALETVLVPAATFTMGSSKPSAASATPETTVTIAHAFRIDKYEVTTVAYQKCVSVGACTPSRAEPPIHPEMCNAGVPGRENNPINCVSRDQAISFCAWREMRLPTEAEWELSARGTDGREYPWGNSVPTCARAKTTECARSSRTSDVGSFPEGASPAGALDMAGNVWEWVDDGWDTQPPSILSTRDPRRPFSGPNGVLRGGSWDFASSWAKSYFRLSFPATTAADATGIRCAKTQ